MLLMPPRETSQESIELALKLTGAIPPSMPELFNPWADSHAMDLTRDGPSQKVMRLAAHLDCQPKYIVAGEALSASGGVFCGIAFTSEKLLLDGIVPRVRIAGRLTKGESPFAELSAAIVWRCLHALQIAECTVLWNALQMHPYSETRPIRTPSREEFEMGKPAMHLLIEAFPAAKIVAVGRKAEGVLKDMGVQLAGAVRHPANGGARLFATGLEELVRLGDANEHGHRP